MNNKVFRHPIRYSLAWLQNHNFLNRLSDKTYCGLVMFSRTGDYPNYRNPKGFNEKMQWLKLYYRNPELTKLVDKVSAREVVSSIVGEEYVIPIIKIWNSPEEIELEQLPNQFVLKCNHDGGVIVCRDKNNFNFNGAVNELSRRLKINYYDHAREWPYKNIKPVVFAEPFVQDGDNVNLPVYKFLCFNGSPLIIQTIQNDKTANETIDYFDLEWNLLDLRQNYGNSPQPLTKPKRLKEMITIARRLCTGYPFIRVDLYQVNETIKFSEFTLFSDAGFEPFYPKEWDRKLGDLIKLPNEYR